MTGYAVDALGIQDIIVCGHTRCGAMQALIHQDSLDNMPYVRRWLSHAAATREIILSQYENLDVFPEALWKATVEENVLVQLENLRTHPCVLAAMSRRELKVHGWVYKFEAGQVFAYDPAAGQFERLDPAADRRDVTVRDRSLWAGRTGDVGERLEARRRLRRSREQDSRSLRLTERVRRERVRHRAAEQDLARLGRRLHLDGVRGGPPSDQQLTVAVAMTGHCCCSASIASGSKTRISATVASGPASAVSSSVRALSGSSSISATPPKMNSVIPFMGTPSRRAVTACESS